MATFGPHGPEKCSGLEVLRFSADELHDEFGPDFAKIADTTERHTTPWGSEQEFVYCYCRMPAGTDGDAGKATRRDNGSSGRI